MYSSLSVTPSTNGAYWLISSPTANISSAQMLPIMAIPAADMGRPKNDAPAPTTAPPTSSSACLPPVSPALMVSAAATPGGQAASAGRNLEPYAR
jgi:hypothetical protein